MPEKIIDAKVISESKETPAPEQMQPVTQAPEIAPAVAEGESKEEREKRETIERVEREEISPAQKNKTKKQNKLSKKKAQLMSRVRSLQAQEKIIKKQEEVMQKLMENDEEVKMVLMERGETLKKVVQSFLTEDSSCAKLNLDNIVKWLELVSDGVFPNEACKQTNLSWAQLSAWSMRFPAFTALRKVAGDCGRNYRIIKQESSAWRRAFTGRKRPVFSKGLLIGYTREYSDRLAELFLCADDPKRFRQSNANVQVNNVQQTVIEMHRE